MIERTCNTCWYWKRSTYLPDGYGICNGIETIDSMDPTIGEAVVETDSYANIVTRLTFGCLLWKAKEPTVERD